MKTSERKLAAYALKLLGVFAAYAVTGRIGLSYGAVHGFATLVWPPTGIAIVALLLLGRRYWPAVAFGALVVNLSAGAAFPVAAGIAAGNTLEALAVVWLLRLDSGFRRALDDPRSVFGFLGLAAGMGTLVGATVGTTVLWAGGVITAQAYAETWIAWWVGDAFGALVIAPFLMVWFGRSRDARRPRLRGDEAVALALVFALVAALMYGRTAASFITPTMASYVMLVPLVWAAVRFGMRGSTAAITAFSLVSVYATAAGRGPFAAGQLNEGIAALQLFVGASSIITLFLGSAHDGRILSEANRDELRMELAEQAEYLKSIVELAPIGIKLLDRDSRVLRVNAAGLRMLGAESEWELAERPILALTETEGRPAFTAMLKRVFDGGSGSLRQNITDLRGAKKTFDVRMVPFRESDGSIKAALAMFDDKTWEVEQERHLQADYEEMEQLNKTLVGRELKMIELKRDLEKLKAGKAGDGTAPKA